MFQQSYQINQQTLGFLINNSYSVPTIGQECHTQACIQSATLIKEYVDFDADPCEDFYQYTCGTWLKNNPDVPNDKSATGTWETIRDENIIVLRSIYEGTYDDFIHQVASGTTSDFHIPEQEQIDRQNFEKIKNYYKQCMDVDAIDAQGSTPILPLISKVLSPLSEKFDKESLTTAIIEMTTQSVRTLFNIAIDQDNMEPDVYSITLHQPDLTLPKEYYIKPEMLKLYRQSLIDLLNVVFGITDNTNIIDNLRMQKLHEAKLKPLSNEEIKASVDRFIELETFIASISHDLGMLQNPITTYERTTITELHEKYPIINWERYFKSLTDGTAPIPDYVILSYKDYLHDVSSWISPVFSSLENEFFPSSSPMFPQSRAQSIKDFFMIKTIIRWTYALDSKTRNAWQPIKALSLAGSHDEPARHLSCIRYAGEALGMLQGRYYAMQKFGGEKERTQLGSMVQDLRAVLLDIVKGTKWFDQPTIEAALEKANKIKISVGYDTEAPDLRVPEVLQRYYEHITISKDSFLQTELSANLWRINHRAKEKIGYPVRLDEWRMNPSRTNAFYDNKFNRLVILAGAANPPLYVPESPAYIKYSSLGFIAAHELTHAFDSIGRYRDGNGKLTQWWTPETVNHYDNLAQCFIEQYGNFTFQGPDNKTVRVNGRLTLGENIADTGALVISYKAFDQIWNDHETLANGGGNLKHMRLPGIDLSPEKLFFINFGMTWCGRRQPHSSLAVAYTNPHSLDKFRANGPVQNFQEFSKIFQCPVGSPMNPEKKCTLWSY